MVLIVKQLHAIKHELNVLNTARKDIGNSYVEERTKKVREELLYLRTQYDLQYPYQKRE